MKNFKSNRKSHLNSERGTAMVEYVVLLCFMAILVVGSVKTTGTNISRILYEGGGSNSTMQSSDCQSPFGCGDNSIDPVLEDDGGFIKGGGKGGSKN